MADNAANEIAMNGQRKIKIVNEFRLKMFSQRKTNGHNNNNVKMDLITSLKRSLFANDAAAAAKRNLFLRMENKLLSIERDANAATATNGTMTIADDDDGDEMNLFVRVKL